MSSSCTYNNDALLGSSEATLSPMRQRKARGKKAAVEYTFITVLERLTLTLNAKDLQHQSL